MKIVIVTGSSRGLGASTALECAKRGMGVIVTYNRNPEKAHEVAKAIAATGGKAVALKLDVGDSQSFTDFRKAVSAQLSAVWDRKRHRQFTIRREPLDQRPEHRSGGRLHHLN
jgi:NAD(P)-dependent dehydrogenase (short-subunit alcohol dehydrogenase family)